MKISVGQFIDKTKIIFPLNAASAKKTTQKIIDAIDVFLFDIFLNSMYYH
jgi:hypothetical protein